MCSARLADAGAARGVMQAGLSSQQMLLCWQHNLRFAPMQTIGAQLHLLWVLPLQDVQVKPNHSQGASANALKVDYSGHAHKSHKALPQWTFSTVKQPASCAWAILC